uniref:Uncharacterized protein n=1 Tax=Mustela putorius furo TaxID=9669 RepID=M3XRR3_MUSPF
MGTPRGRGRTQCGFTSSPEAEGKALGQGLAKLRERKPPALCLSRCPLKHSSAFLQERQP